MLYQASGIRLTASEDYNIFHVEEVLVKLKERKLDLSKDGYLPCDVPASGCMCGHPSTFLSCMHITWVLV